MHADAQSDTLSASLRDGSSSNRHPDACLRQKIAADYAERSSKAYVSAIRRWLVPDRRGQHARRQWLHADRRPRQGRDQVRRRVDRLDRPGEHRDGAPGRVLGRAHRREAPEVGRVPAAAGDEEARRQTRPRGTAEVRRGQDRLLPSPIPRGIVTNPADDRGDARSGIMALPRLPPSSHRPASRKRWPRPRAHRRCRHPARPARGSTTTPRVPSRSVPP